MGAARLLRILASSRLVGGLGGHGLDDDDDDDGIQGWGFRGLRRRARADPPDPNRFPKVPSKEGRELMDSGAFGRVEPVWTSVDVNQRKKKKLARRILDRELGLGNGVQRKINQGVMMQQMIPSEVPEKIIHYPAPVCCGQFSDDGNFFYACVKDLRVRMYDTSDPYNWKHYKTADYPMGQWTLTDADLSPDNKWLAYSSLQSHVAFAPTDPNDEGEPYTLNLGSRPTTPAPGGNHWRNRENFAIFSVRFSGDGRRIVAGTGVDSIVVYDIESRTVLHNIAGHENDVNAVCFADKSSPHILYSGSDDCTIKVWDTRSMGDGREGAAFVGHIEGITYIDSKGDGRYILSNGKDQSMKLWDIRNAMTTARFHSEDVSRTTRRREYEYDYRWEDYDEDMWFPHPYDNSAVTFRGHKVQRTLIRCHFSPEGSSDSRYVYSGSQDGFVYVWNLDGTLEKRIDVKMGLLENMVSTYGYGGGAGNRGRWNTRRNHFTTLVRDVGWHPKMSMLVGKFRFLLCASQSFGYGWRSALTWDTASSWTGPSMDGGTATVHSFNEGRLDEGEPPMGFVVDEKMRPFGGYRPVADDEFEQGIWE
jgi:WD repeat-containing protein 23